MSPRRSSRARTTQTTPSGPQDTNSSSSSITSGRASQSAGPDQKSSSQRNSVAVRSQSSEDPNVSAKAQARRTRSSQDDVKGEATNAIEDGIEDEGEEEVTRCICGNQEYPGLPVSIGDSTKGSSKGDPDPAAFTEDATGWFIQCDGCKVWQHGGCVGIMDESTSPEEYFCEQCRKDLHKITTNPNGRKYSHYIPAQEVNSPQSSPAPVFKKHSKRSKDGKSAKLNAEQISKGRRSTMNSRDAAFEEEQIRLAIEESKRVGGGSSTATGIRKGKRSRSESEERNEDAKRQRTTSGSASSASQSKSRRRDSDSQEETEKPERLKNIRGAAARNHRNKEVRDREAQRERERADPGKRKSRTERGQDEGSSPEKPLLGHPSHMHSRAESDATPEPLSRTMSARGTKPPATSNSFIAPQPPDHLPPKTSHKKTGRPPTRGRGRVGRNQYTRDREIPTQPSDANNISPARSNSSPNADGGTPHVNGIDNSNGVGKPSRPRQLNASKTTMTEMKRRVAGILEFISHTQVEMAGTPRTSTTKSSTSTNTPPGDSNGNTQNGGSESNSGKGGDFSEKAVNAALSDLEGIDEQAFGMLSSLEMMEVLTRRLMRWQGEYGKHGDK